MGYDARCSSGGLWISYDHQEIFIVRRSPDTGAFSLFASTGKAATVGIEPASLIWLRCPTPQPLSHRGGQQGFKRKQVAKKCRRQGFHATLINCFKQISYTRDNF